MWLQARRTCVLVAALALAGCWAQPGFDARRAADNPFETQIGPGNVAHLHRAWSATLPSAAGTPVIAPGRVIVDDASAVSSLDSSDGSSMWRTVEDLSGSGLGDATIRGSTVLVPVYARLGTRGLDLGTGRDVGQIASGDLGTAVASGSKVVGVSAGIGMIHTLGVTVDDLDHPELSWSSTEGIVGAGFDGPVPTTAAIGLDRFFIGVSGSVVAYPLTPPTCPAPTIPPTPCTPLWSANVGFSVSYPVLGGTTVFAGTGSGIAAISAANGSVEWSADLGSPAAQPPAVGDGIVAVPTADGRLVALDANGCGASTCAPRWTANLSSPASVQPAIADGVAYTGSADGSLRAFTASGCGTTTCAPRWSSDAGSAITGAPAIAFGRLVVGTADGHVLAYAT
jgi:hypothetical protein